MPSDEHFFLSNQVDHSLVKYASNRLFGVLEAERKTFDYACLLERDFSRPLICQTLWSHHEGIEKDLRTLLHDRNAKIKLYIFKDTIRHRNKIDEIVRGYKENPSLEPLLAGLRLFPIPSDFDANSDDHRSWMESYIDKKILEDLLFSVVFGKITPHDFKVFLNAIGIEEKFALLEISVADTSTINSKNDIARAMKGKNDRASQSLNRLLEIFNALGIIQYIWEEGRFKLIATVKGRLLYDLFCLLAYESQTKSCWSSETREILIHLGCIDTSFMNIISERLYNRDRIELTSLLSNLHGFIFNRYIRDEMLDYSRIYSSQPFYSIANENIAED